MKNKDFYLIKFGRYGIGYDADIELRKNIIYGTWMECARELIRLDESIGTEKNIYRHISKFALPDVKRKRKMFYVL